MTKEQEQVKEWMNAFRQTFYNKPTQVNSEVLRLRAKLILEEAFETITQGLGLDIYIQTPTSGDYLSITEDNVKGKEIDITFRQAKPLDLVETADGLADLHYVGYAGTGCALGIDMEPAFAEVQKSNMSKLWTKKESESRDIKSFPLVREIDSTDDRRFIVAREDGKIMKSPSYSPADIKSVIEKQSYKN
jgi:predicted HAD superfamily Cof-like phosphohydrolase